MNELVSDVIRDVHTHANSLSDMLPLNPLSSKAIFLSKSFTTAGAIKLIDKQLKALEGKEGAEAERSRAILNKAKDYLLERHDKLLSHDSLLPLSKDEVSSLMGSSGPDKGITIVGRARVLLDDTFKVPDLETGVPEFPDSHPDLREEGIMEHFLEQVFEQAGVPKPTDLPDALLQARLMALNEQPWNSIYKDLVVETGGTTVTVESSIVPQSQLGQTFTDMNGGGVVCHMGQSYKHATTLAVSTLKAPDGTTLFEGVRHGSIAAYDISSSKLKRMDRESLEAMVQDLLGTGMWRTDENGYGSLQKTVDAILSDSSYRSECAKLMRARASYLRAQDVATSMLVKNTSKLNEAIENARSGDLTKEVQININSIGLLTPDLARSIWSGGESKALNEKKMLQDQLTAWEQLSGDPQPKVLTVKDENGQDVKVRVRITANAFNFGVNGGAYHRTGLDVGLANQRRAERQGHDRVHRFAGGARRR